MKFLVDLGTNFWLMSVVAAWFIAQVLKFFTGVFKLKKFTAVEFLFGTGGMPSSHTAAVCAMVSACVIKCGFGSVEFALSALLAMIVMRDATGMRRQVGEHAKALNRLFQNLSDSLNDPELTEKALEELAGHTPLQVLAGMLIGLLLPVGFMFIPAFEVGPNAVELSAAIQSFFSGIL